MGTPSLMVVQKPAGPAEFAGLDVGNFVAAWYDDPAKRYVRSGKGMFLPIPQTTGTRTVAVRNSRFHDITRDSYNPATKRIDGIHTEGIFFSSGMLDTDLTVELTDNVVERIDGGGIHYDGGSGHLLFARNTIRDFAYTAGIDIKILPQCKLWLTFEANAVALSRVMIDTSRLGPTLLASVVQEVRLVNQPDLSFIDQQGRPVDFVSLGVRVLKVSTPPPAPTPEPPPPPTTPSTPPPPAPAPAYDPLNDLRDLRARIDAIIAKVAK